jgi:hypothetical protein
MPDLLYLVRKLKKMITDIYLDGKSQDNWGNGDIEIMEMLDSIISIIEKENK